MTKIRLMQQQEAEQVLSLWQQACIDAVGHPLPDANAQQIVLNLRQYAVHETCHCLVAIEDTKIVGFMTFCLWHHPIEHGSLGEIEELYVLSAYDRDLIRKDLIQVGVNQLKNQGAGVITVRVAVDEPEDLAFWKQLNWSQDTVNFAIYSNVPGDPELQSVWDSYNS